MKRFLLPLLVLTVSASAVELAGDFKGPLGLQLYSLRDAFKADVPGTLDKVKAFGFTEDAVGPEEVGEFLAAFCLGGVAALEEFELCRAGLFRDAKLERRACLLHATVAERSKEVIEENLRLAFFRRPSASERR